MRAGPAYARGYGEAGAHAPFCCCPQRSAGILPAGAETRLRQGYGEAGGSATLLPWEH
jgi:hypothetical protein